MSQNKEIIIHLYYGTDSAFKKNSPRRLPLIVAPYDKGTPYLKGDGRLLKLEQGRKYLQEMLDKETSESAWKVLRFKVSEIENIPEFIFAKEKYKPNRYVQVEYFMHAYFYAVEQTKKSLDNVIKSDLLEFEAEIGLPEGGKTMRLTSYYERQATNRIEAVRIHKKICKACGFDFEKTYGTLGEGYIEVHHLIPISSFDKELIVNPENDLTVLCANCHRMMHRNKNKIMTLEELRGIIETYKNQ